MITTIERKDETVYLPHKLIVPKGQVKFLEGDIIHGGGNAPSGMRCHGFLFNPADIQNKQNTLLKDTESGEMLDNSCVTSYSDKQK